jgi:hypothetical protein
MAAMTRMCDTWKLQLVVGGAKCWGSPDNWMGMVKLLYIPPQPVEFLTHVFLCQVCRKPTRARHHQNEELSQKVFLLSSRQTATV